MYNTNGSTQFNRKLCTFVAQKYLLDLILFSSNKVIRFYSERLEGVNERLQQVKGSQFTGHHVTCNNLTY